MSFLTKHWKWFLAAIVVLVILWQMTTGWVAARKYFNMITNQLRREDSQITKDKDAWIKQCEEEILKMQAEKEALRAGKLQAQRDADTERKAKIEALGNAARLQGENDVLKKKLADVVVSSDIDTLIRDLRGRGINVRRLEPR